jgi:cation:H+ antiporter
VADAGHHPEGAPVILWFELLACTAVIFFSGTRLSTSADAIAEKTGMGRTWIGVILLASITSLPELITGASSVLIYDLPNITTGDLLGSCMFNLLILAILDVRRSRAPISSLAHQGQVLTAAFGILLLGGTTISILSAERMPSLGWIGVNSFALLLLYLLAMRVVFRYEKKRLAEFLTEVAQEARYGEISKQRAYLRLVFYGAMITLAATFLPRIADAIATRTGLGDTFVGSIFVAISTSLPEVVVSRAALKIGAVDLAVGNILGSNLSNIAILAIDDFLYWKGPLVQRMSAANAITAVGAMIMTGITMIALVYRSQKRVLLFPWESLGIYAVFALTSLLLFLQR